VDEVCARLKSGKEADLWIVRHGGELVAAKVYKTREARSFRNDAAYREGRQVRNTRTQRAMQRGSRFGQAAAEEAWKVKEADALHALHAAGVRVPRPVMFYEGVLLMELVVDAHGRPAPRLVDARVAREQAAPLYADLRSQAVRMLGCDLIHGDLSPYNVLLGRDGPVVIDFPQVVGAAHNSQAESFFRRDLENIRRFFAGIDHSLRAAEGDAREIWRAYVRRELTPDFVPAARPPQPQRPAPAPAGHGQGEGRGQRQGRGQGHGRSQGDGRGHEQVHGPGHGHAQAHGSTQPRGHAQVHGQGREQGARHAQPPAPAPSSSGRREPERRRDRGPRRPTAAPEVIRISRPPLAPAGPAHPHAPRADAPPRTDGARRHGRRRR
jgi:RIO kinase 1